MGLLLSYLFVCRKCSTPLEYYSYKNEYNFNCVHHRFINNICKDCNQRKGTDKLCRHTWIHLLHYSRFRGLCRKNEYKNI